MGGVWMGVDAHEARGAGGGGLEEVKVKGKVDERVGRGVEMGCCPGAAGGSSAGGRRRGGGGARVVLGAACCTKYWPTCRKAHAREARAWGSGGAESGLGLGLFAQENGRWACGAKGSRGRGARLPAQAAGAQQKNRNLRLEMLTAALPPLGGRPRPRRRYAGGGGRGPLAVSMVLSV